MNFTSFADLGNKGEDEDEEEEDPYESIYEEVNPPGNGGDSDLFYGSESEFDEIDDFDQVGDGAGNKVRNNIFAIE